MRRFPWLANTDAAASRYIAASIRANTVKSLVHILFLGSSQIDSVPPNWHLLGPQFRKLARMHSANQFAAYGFDTDDQSGEEIATVDQGDVATLAKAALTRAADVVAVKAYRLAATLAGVKLTADEQRALGGPDASILWGHRQPGLLHNDNLLQLVAIFHDALSSEAVERRMPPEEQTARLLAFVVFGLNVGSDVVNDYYAVPEKRELFIGESPAELVHQLRLASLRGDFNQRLRYRLTNPMAILSRSKNPHTVSVAGVVQDAKLSADGTAIEGKVLNEGAIANLFANAADLHAALQGGASALDKELLLKVVPKEAAAAAAAAAATAAAAAEETSSADGGDAGGGQLAAPAALQSTTDAPTTKKRKKKKKKAESGGGAASGAAADSECAAMDVDPAAPEATAGARVVASQADAGTAESPDASGQGAKKRQKRSLPKKAKYPGLGGSIVHACIVRSLELTGLLGDSIFDEAWLAGHTGTVR